MKNLLPLLFILLSFLVVKAQNTPQEPQLSETDIELFLKSYKPIVKDLYKLGKEYEGISDPTKADAVMASTEVKGVFQKYGWTDQQIDKFGYLTSIFLHQKYKEQLASIPAEQKQMVIESMPEYAKYLNGSAFHPKDLELIEKYEPEIETLFREIQAEY